MANTTRYDVVIGALVVTGGILLYSVLTYEVYDHRKRCSEDLASIKRELEREQELRMEERNSRISAQQKLRKFLSTANVTNDDDPMSSSISKGTARGPSFNLFHYRAIGVLESPFLDRRGTPRQPQLVPAAKGRIRFDRRIIQQEHFEELSQFSHIWVIFVFHCNTNTDKQAINESQRINDSKSMKMKTVPSKVKPPRLHGSKVGCLSTRSPHRPNNLGLSVCEVISVGKDFIDIACVDMVDGTPILDVKPYIPYDVIPSDYVVPAFPNVPRRSLRVPEWVVEADATALAEREVTFSEAALYVMHSYIDTEHNSAKQIESVQEMQQLVSQVLRQDIRGIAQGRGKGNAEAQSSTYMCRLNGLEFEFQTLVDNSVEVLTARSISHTSSRDLSILDQIVQ
eukprot:gene25278-33808_t